MLPGFTQTDSHSLFFALILTLVLMGMHLFFDIFAGFGSELGHKPSLVTLK
jgi:hypothetical protein